jgi:uncharacterized membrane protein YhfC
MMVLAAAIEILFPLGLALWIARRWRVSWKFFGYGALIFLVFQLLTRVPAVQILQPLLASTLQQSPWYKYGWFVLLALTAGLFEEGGRYLGYRFLWKKEGKNWSRALMYGAGHGGLESMVLVGGLTILGVINAVVIFQIDPAMLPADQAQLIYQAREMIALTTWWLPLLAMLERLMAMAIQVALSVLVLQVFTRSRFHWWWIALGYHALVDLVAVLVSDGVSGALPEWAAALVTEAAILPFALFSLWLIWRLRPRTAEVETDTHRSAQMGGLDD